MRALVPAPLAPLLLAACQLVACQLDDGARHGDAEHAWDDDQGELASSTGGTLCDPLMEVFPVEGPHNIGYDHASCGTGTCTITCPDAHANSDWGGDHHGIDVFAWQRAPLVAVADGVVVAAGEPSATSGLRIRIEDACGWQYYYGHMDEYVVDVGDVVQAGDLVGYMGYTGTSSTHLHFNVSPWGDYDDDIDPFGLLAWTSGTACDASAGGEDGGGGESSGGESSGGESSGGDTSGGDTSGGESSGGGEGAAGCGVYAATTYLGPDTYVQSCDGRFALVMQSDGNLVLYQSGGIALWYTGTDGHAGAWAAMQDDGNLVVYSSGGAALWSSGTQGNPGAVLAVQDDGNVVIYGGGRALWDTGTCCR